MALSIELTRPRPGVALITFANPPRNQMSSEAAHRMHLLLSEVEADESLRCLVLTGSERSWCAGADLREEEQLTDGATGRSDDELGFGALMTRIESLRVPVVAAVNGYALGGGMELALCCDIRLGSPDARFMCAAVNMGLILSWYRLPRTIGLGPAKQMLLSGEIFDADWALRTGLITELHSAGQLVSRSLDLAERIASKAPLSVEATKECANQAFELDHDSAMDLQRQKFLALVDTADHQEAVTAFLQRRPAIFERR